MRADGPAGAGKPRLTCTCNTLLRSSCPACSPPPAYSRTGWAETGGSSRPFHTTLWRGGKRFRMKCWHYSHTSAFPGQGGGPSSGQRSPLGWGRGRRQLSRRGRTGPTEDEPLHQRLPRGPAPPRPARSSSLLLETAMPVVQGRKENQFTCRLDPSVAP